MAEQHNLKDQYPDMVADLKATAEGWRAKIEDRWQNQWLPRVTGTTTHPAAATTNPSPSTP